jgi:hypothetical protein
VREMSKIQGVEYWMGELERLEVKRRNWEKYHNIFGDPKLVFVQEIQKENPLIQIRVR